MGNTFSSGLPRWLWAVLFVLGTCALLVGGYRYYQSETERIRQEKYREIAAIGKLKAGQIEQWRQERLSDISRSSKAPYFREGLQEWFLDRNNPALQTKLHDRLALDQRDEGYADVLLLDTEYRILLSADPQPHPLSSEAKKAVAQALAGRTPMLSDLYRCPHGVVHVDAVGPILDDNGQPIAVWVLRSNAESLLYPLIQSWPTPSRTAETLLVRREGDELLFLNDLRHKPNSALSLREPLSRQNLPAVQAVLGKEGIFQGKDYRGVEVLADLRPIPRSPWFIVAKVDSSEILAEARYRGGIVALFAILFIVLAASVTAYGYRHRQVQLYRDLYRSEREQREAQEEFRTTLYSIGDAVITADTAGMVKQMNPVAERLTGWQEAEARGKPVREVFRIVSEETRANVEDPVARVLREGVVVGLANHTLLISRDGKEHPIADSGAPIRDENGVIIGVVLVFQDQTENRRRLDERETRATLLQLLNEQNDTHEIIRNVTGFLQKRSGCEAVGVRLKEGNDFPYFEMRGFTQEFVQAESSLCSRDDAGELLRDSLGNPVLECMCGNVLSGRFDPRLPFFTAKGSFWSNSTTELLASTTEEDRQARTRNRCNGEGYESVALFRLRSDDETLGLLQLNDLAKGRFTPELLEFMESTADEIAIALAKRQALARLLESEERFSKSFKNNPAWLAIVHMGTNKVVEVNDAWARIFGYTRVEAIGHTTVELGIYDDETYGKIVEEAKAKGSVRNAEVNIKTRTGENRALLVSREVIGIKGEPYLLAMGLDITERKRAEEALAEQVEFMSLLMEAIPLPVFFKGVNHVYIGCNSAFAEFVGLPKEKIVGKPALDVVSQETAETFREHDETLFRNPGAQTYATSVKRSDGSTRDVIFHKATYGDSGSTVSGLIGVILDITDRKILEQQLFQAQKMEAVGTLAGGVAHDFNNLLQVVLGYSELMLSDDHLPVQYRDDLSRVNQAARNGADLVQRLLTFSRKSEAKPCPLNLNSQIRQLLQMLSRTIPKMIEIELVLADDLATIDADPTQMEQILMNLAVNARDAMLEGGKLIIKTENVTFDEDYCRTHIEAKPGRHVLLSVSDTGHGMDKETAQHIFEPFFTTKGPCEGTGLGLAMVYGIVKQHGGHIICYSEPSHGTIFKIYFPVLVSGDELPEIEISAIPRGGSETILLVDDEPLIRDFGSRILMRAGYKVIAASNGKEALELYQACCHEIAVVILDLIMPEMGGKQCLAGLLSLDPSAKVIIASGYSASDATREALTSGAKGFVNKPYDMRQVLNIVRAVIDDHTGPEDGLG
jgi:two-component system, cell cycle sensor histidine kinase and response regulator CckA